MKEHKEARKACMQGRKEYKEGRTKRKEGRKKTPLVSFLGLAPRPFELNSF
jgi:hypothetical protein